MIVLLHGVPETAAIWDDVREHLDQPSVALQLPGFGCPRPNGFPATKDAYVDWLVEELAAIDEPVDLVGHDWGGAFSLRIGQRHPELVRSWASDVAGLFHPDYVWHDFAQLWQTEGAGEDFWAGSLATPVDQGAQTYQGFGLDEAAARKLWQMADETMATCILDLYRSATPNPYKEWSDSYTRSTKPALAIAATNDPFTATGKAPEVVEIILATTATIEAGHFWPLENPQGGARIINEFVASL
ncbi:MAG: alpha/beta hydrolase [Acidimicrobiales bacterium]|nr:alpha/beta hydrolase [Acidimicrobiales bacterium]